MLGLSIVGTETAEHVGKIQTYYFPDFLQNTEKSSNSGFPANI